MKAGERWACRAQGPTAPGCTPKVQCFGAGAGEAYLQAHIFTAICTKTPSTAPSLRCKTSPKTPPGRLPAEAARAGKGARGRPPLPRCLQGLQVLELLELLRLLLLPFPLMPALALATAARRRLLRAPAPRLAAPRLLFLLPLLLPAPSLPAGHRRGRKAAERSRGRGAAPLRPSVSPSPPSTLRISVSLPLAAADFLRWQLRPPLGSPLPAAGLRWGGAGSWLPALPAAFA